MLLKRLSLKLSVLRLSSDSAIVVRLRYLKWKRVIGGIVVGLTQNSDDVGRIGNFERI
jgi:hypothetical protein